MEERLQADSDSITVDHHPGPLLRFQGVDLFGKLQDLFKIAGGGIHLNDEPIPFRGFFENFSSLADLLFAKVSLQSRSVSAEVVS